MHHSINQIEKLRLAQDQPGQALVWHIAQTIALTKLGQALVWLQRAQTLALTNMTKRSIVFT